jgi:predicted ATPase
LFADLNATPSGNGHHRLLFTDRWSPTVRYEPAEVSDGTILLVAFLTLLHMETPPELLCIEEPERSLHPFLLAEVLDLLRALTTGALSPSGAKVQVLIATHSPQVVSLVRPEEVRFVSRSLDDGNTVVRAAPVDDEGFRAALKAHDDSLGDVWLSGGLGGVPGTPV